MIQQTQRWMPLLIIVTAPSLLPHSQSMTAGLRLLLLWRELSFFPDTKDITIKIRNMRILSSVSRV